MGARHRACIVVAQIRMGALHVFAAFDMTKPGYAQQARESFEIVTEFVALEQLAGGRAGAGISQQILEECLIFGPPVPVFAPAAKVVRIAVHVRSKPLLDVGDDDSNDAARFQYTPYLLHQELGLTGIIEVFEEMRQKHVSGRAILEWHVPAHVESELGWMNVHIDPASQPVRTCPKMQLQPGRVAIHA